MQKLCPMCNLGIPHGDEKKMYPGFCTKCAERLTRSLDKHGLLNNLKKKNKKK